MPTHGIERRAMAKRLTRRAMIAAAAVFATGRAAAAPVALTPDHAGRHMWSRSGARVGPIEYGADSFGYDSEKRWRAPLGGIRAYYWPDGRVVADEDGSRRYRWVIGGLHLFEWTPNRDTNRTQPAGGPSSVSGNK